MTLKHFHILCLMIGVGRMSTKISAVSFICMLGNHCIIDINININVWINGYSNYILSWSIYIFIFQSITMIFDIQNFIAPDRSCSSNYSMDYILSILWINWIQKCHFICSFLYIAINKMNEIFFIYNGIMNDGVYLKNMD